MVFGCSVSFSLMMIKLFWYNVFVFHRYKYWASMKVYFFILPLIYVPMENKNVVPHCVKSVNLVVYPLSDTKVPSKMADIVNKVYCIAQQTYKQTVKHLPRFTDFTHHTAMKFVIK